MIKLTIDIETLPVGEKKKAIAQGVVKKKKEDWFKKTALDGNFGRIFCIGYIKEPPKINRASIIKGREKNILEKFWKIARNVDLFIGHNIIDFDLPFIYKRSIIHGVKPTRRLNFARYRSEPIYDTLREWENWSLRSHTSLDTLAKILNLPTSKDDINGSQVYETYLKGEAARIYKYCKKDVELTRKIYYKMQFKQP
jgi:3'-5' exonuclease